MGRIPLGGESQELKRCRATVQFKFMTQKLSPALKVGKLSASQTRRNAQDLRVTALKTMVNHPWTFYKRCSDRAIVTKVNRAFEVLEKQKKWYVGRPKISENRCTLGRRRPGLVRYENPSKREWFAHGEPIAIRGNRVVLKRVKTSKNAKSLQNDGRLAEYVCVPQERILDKLPSPLE